MENKENNGWKKFQTRWTEFLQTLGIALIPFVTLFVLIMIKAKNGGELVWGGMVLLIVLAMVVSAIFAIVSRPRVALGILAAMLIGLIGLVVSCSTVLAS
jgi:hypothetical protein